MSNVALEKLVKKQTRELNFGTQVIASGKAKPPMFARARKMLAKNLPYAMRPRPADLPEDLYNNYINATRKLAEALITFQNKMPNPQAIAVTNGTQELEVVPEADDYVDPDSDLFIDAEYDDYVEPLEAPGYWDMVVDSMTTHPIIWGLAAAGTIAAGYAVMRKD